MSTKEALKELQDYLTDVEWNDHAVKKVEGILDKAIKANSKTIVRKKYIKVYSGVQGLTVKNELVDFDAIAEKVCEAHNLPVNAIFSKNRSEAYVNARADFVFRVKRANPNQSLKSIGAYMRRDHTTVIHYISGIRYGHYTVGVGEEV